jgi:hypothetical protein
MYAGKPDPITNQPMWQCIASNDERHAPLSSSDSTGFTQSTVYVKKQTKETFVGLDRGLELNSSPPPVVPNSEKKKCNVLKSSDLDIILYTNIAISFLAVGFFAYTFAK